MKFNCFNKTRMVLAIVMILITVAYLFSLSGTLIEYDTTEFVFENGEMKRGADGDPIFEDKHYEVSALKFAWFPHSGGPHDEPHYIKLYNEIGNSEYADEAYFEEYTEANFISDEVSGMAYLFILGIIVIILAIMSMFSKCKVLWSVFASVWGIFGAYYYLTSYLVKCAGKIEMLAPAGGMMKLQTILALAGCIVGIASFVIAVYSRHKTRKSIMEAALKRD